MFKYAWIFVILLRIDQIECTSYRRRVYPSCDAIKSRDRAVLTVRGKVPTAPDTTCQINLYRKIGICFRVQCSVYVSDKKKEVGDLHFYADGYPNITLTRVHLRTHTCGLYTGTILLERNQDIPVSEKRKMTCKFSGIAKSDTKRFCNVEKINSKATSLNAVTLVTSALVAASLMLIG